MARTPIDEVADVVKDAAYVSVGLGVIVFQRLQVRRNELTKSLNGQAGDVKGVIDLAAAVLGERMKMVEERVGAALDRGR